MPTLGWFPESERKKVEEIVFMIERDREKWIQEKRAILAVVECLGARSAWELVRLLITVKRKARSRAQRLGRKRANLVGEVRGESLEKGEKINYSRKWAPELRRGVARLEGSKPPGSEGRVSGNVLVWSDFRDKPRKREERSLSSSGGMIGKVGLVQKAFCRMERPWKVKPEKWNTVMAPG